MCRKGHEVLGPTAWMALTFVDSKATGMEGAELNWPQEGVDLSPHGGGEADWKIEPPSLFL